MTGKEIEDKRARKGSDGCNSPGFRLVTENIAEQRKQQVLKKKPPPEVQDVYLV